MSQVHKTVAGVLPLAFPAWLIQVAELAELAETPLAESAELACIFKRAARAYLGSQGVQEVAQT